MPLRQLVKRIISSQTSEQQAKLIKHLSETDAMMTAARKAHGLVQKVESHVEQLVKGGTTKGGSLPTDPKAPLSHEQLTHADHMAARGGSGFDVFGALRRAKDQVKSDAKADWQDFKNKFK